MTFRIAEQFKSLYPVNRHWPLFIWKHCCDCNSQWVRERGWSFETGPYTYSEHLGRTGYMYYVCPNCAPAKGFAEIIADRIANPALPERPPPPPAPPHKLYRGTTDVNIIEESG